jgi:phospholipid-translocating ATPase
LLLSFLNPITLKVLLPIFRFIYGIFISEDLNFVDSASHTPARAFSTSITENLGVLDVIISDKTGTLTENKLVLRTLTVENTQFGYTKKAASLVVDEVLHNGFNDAASQDFRLMFEALSLCHSIKIGENQKLLGTSAHEIGILKTLKKLQWRFDSSSLGNVSVTSPLES